jgi:hypothetical protein
MKSVRLTLYNEVMAHRVPLLLVNCNVVSHVKDWSSEVRSYYYTTLYLEIVIIFSQR